jgi:nucleoid-associated protein YgaU
VSVTSELPVTDLPSRRRRDQAAVIPFPRRTAEKSPDDRSILAVKAAHPAGKGLIGPRPVAARSFVPPEVRAVPVAVPAPEPVVPPELTAVIPFPGRSLYVVPADVIVELPALAPAPAPARPVAPPRLRLTRRGRLVLTALGALLLAAIITFAAPALAHVRSTPAVPTSAPAVVVVQPGDTLWSIARRVAPDRDTRQVVAALRRINALPTADVQPGQRLTIRQP